MEVPESKRSIMKPGDKRATNAVFRRLQASPDSSHWETMGTYLIGKDTTLEEFIKSAKAWLGDKTEIKTSTLDNADWQEVFTYFKSFHETEEAQATVPCGGTLRFVEYQGAKHIMCLSHANHVGATILDYRNNQYQCLMTFREEQ